VTRPRLANGDQSFLGQRLTALAVMLDSTVRFIAEVQIKLQTDQCRVLRILGLQKEDAREAR
jgi:hypothetical protein